MVSKYKCNFCGAPRLSTDTICKFCGQKFLYENNSSLNIRFKNYFSFLKDNNKFKNSFRKAINFSYKEQVGAEFKESLLDSFKETSSTISNSGKIFTKVISTSGNDFSKFVSNNTKLILVSFLGLIALIITTKSITDYVNLQETKRILKIEKEVALKNKKEKKENIEIANSKLKENDLNGALKAYFKSIEIPSSFRSNLEDRDAYKGIAEILLKQKRFTSAAQYLSKIIDENLTKEYLTEIYYKRGLAYHASKKYNLAKNDLSQALFLSKSDGIPKNISNFNLNLYYMRSESFLNTGNYRNAINDINKVIAEDKNIKPQYYQIRSSANYFLGNYEDSISDATSSLDFIKNDNQLKSKSFFRRAESYKAKNNYKQSCLDFEKAYSFNKLKFNSTVNSKFYKNNCAEKVEYHLADPWSLLRQGKAYDFKTSYGDSTFEKNDPEKEKYLIKRLYAIFKKSSNFDEKKCKQSFEVLNSLVKVSQNPDVYFYRGRSKYLCKADYEGAINDLNKAITLKPNYSEYIYFRGIAKDRFGKHQEAINDFKKAINLDSSKHYYYYSLGITFYKLREFENAKTQFTNSLYLNNYKWNGYSGGSYNFTYTYRGLLNRARAKRHLKDYLSGLKDLNLAIEKCLNDLCYPNEPYIEKGNIQFLLDDTNSACRSWNQGKEKIWESQFKLENIGNESVYNIYQDFCT